MSQAWFLEVDNRVQSYTGELSVVSQEKGKEKEKLFKKGKGRNKIVIIDEGCDCLDRKSKKIYR